MTKNFLPRRNANELVFPTLGTGDTLVLHDMTFEAQPVLSIGAQYDGGSFNAAQLSRTQVAGLIRTLQYWMLNSKLPEDSQPLKAPVCETATTTQA